MRPAAFALAAATLVVASLTACSPDTEAESEGQTGAWTVAPLPMVEIGEVDGEAPYLFQSIRAARLLSDGRIAVADGGQSVVRVFSPDGGFLTEFGGPGEGPGEFGYINSLSITPPDTLEVYDSGEFRLSRFLTDGTLLSTLSIRGDGGFPEGYIGRFTDGTMAVSWIRLERGERGPLSPDLMEVGRFNTDGERIMTLGEGTGMWRAGGPLYPFSPRFHAFLRRDTVYFTDGLRSELNMVDAEGSSLGLLQFPIVNHSSDEAKEMLLPSLRDGDTPEMVDVLSEMANDSVPAVAEVHMDSEERIWVKEYDPRTDSNWLSPFGSRTGGRWWVVDLAGGVIANVDLPEGVSFRDARRGLLLGVSKDAFGVERVVLYSVQEGG